MGVRIKLDADGSTERFKGRVGGGKSFSQLPGYDFVESFTPSSEYDSLRCLLAIAAHHG